MPRAKSKGAYVPLAAQYYLDDAILEAGPTAELMWVRILSFLASVPTDGFITERQLKTIGVGLRDYRQRVATLQLVGLLHAVDDGYVARSWQKWNRTTEEMNKELAKDRERKARNKAEVTPDSGRNPNPVHAESGSSTEQSSTEQSSTSTSDAIAPTESTLGSQYAKRLCDVLVNELKRNGSKFPDPITKAWLDAARLMVDSDHREPRQAKELIEWACRDSFWRANILSMPKFREKYDTVRLASIREPSRKTRTEENLSTVALYAAQQQQGITA